MTRSRYAAAALSTLLALGGGTSAAAATSATQQAGYLAANCANCHGTDGRSAGGGGMPGLAGLSSAYFVEQMRLFRDGKRQATVMHQIAKGYTEEQVAALAEYFAGQSAAPGGAQGGAARAGAVK